MGFMTVLSYAGDVCTTYWFGKINYNFYFICGKNIINFYLFYILAAGYTPNVILYSTTTASTRYSSHGKADFMMVWAVIADPGILL